MTEVGQAVRIISSKGGLFHNRRGVIIKQHHSASGRPWLGVRFDDAGPGSGFSKPWWFEPHELEASAAREAE